MSHYSENEASVRMSLFKPSGKWYSDHAVDMSGYYHPTEQTPLIHDAVRHAFETRLNRSLEPDWMLVCLEPYHVHSHPIMIKG